MCVWSQLQKWFEGQEFPASSLMELFLAFVAFGWLARSIKLTWPIFWPNLMGFCRPPDKWMLAPSHSAQKWWAPYFSRMPKLCGCCPNLDNYSSLFQLPGWAQMFSVLFVSAEQHSISFSQSISLMNEGTHHLAHVGKLSNPKLLHQHGTCDAVYTNAEFST